MATAKPKTKTFKCKEPGCGKEFSLERGLKRHMSQTHGAPLSDVTLGNRARNGHAESDAERHQRGLRGKNDARKERREAELRAKQDEEYAARVGEDSVSFRVRANLRELAAPLREEHATIERRLVVLGREQADLREAKRQIERTLQNLEGPQAPARSAPDFSRADFATKQKSVERFIETHREQLVDGFTASDLNRQMKEAGVTPVMSPEKTRAVIQVLHERGIVRADRIVKGGGQLFMIIGARTEGTNGAS